MAGYRAVAGYRGLAGYRGQHILFAYICLKIGLGRETFSCKPQKCPLNLVPFVLPMEEGMKPHSLANSSQVRHRERMYMAAAAPKKRRISGSKLKELQDSTLSRDSCSGRHQTGMKPGEYGEMPFRRDSWNRWQPEEKKMSICTRRPSCLEGKRPRSRASERQIAEQVNVLFLLKLKSVISALSILGQTFSWSREHMEANGGSTLLSRLVIRWTSDQECMATHYSEDL